MRTGKPLLGLAFAAFVALAAVSLACGGGEGGPQAASSTPTRSPRASAAFEFDCSGQFPGSQADASRFPVTIEDDAGQAVVLEQPPAAIASLSAGHTEILFAIGAGGQVAAADNFSDCPDAAAGLMHIDAFSPSVESIVAAQPDLVLLFFDPPGLRKSLEQAGIDVILLNSPESVNGVYDQIDLLGRATGHSEEARAVVAGMKDAVKAIERALPAGRGPTAFHEIDSTYYTAGPDSFVGDLYRLLRARNIAEATGQAYAQMNAEAIIEADPEVIVLADEDAGESPQTVAARPGWGTIAAVRNNRVYTVDPDIFSRPGPRLVEALEILARLLYPESFQ